MSVLVLSEPENEEEQLLEALQEDTVVEAVAETRRSDERANVPVSVVTERFLRAILDRVPLDRIEELHLFSPLRQGTIETGIAVVAARVIVMEEVAVALPLELQLEGEASTAAEAAEKAKEAKDAEEARAAAEILEEEREPDVESSVEVERDEIDGDDVASEEVESEQLVTDHIKHYAAHDNSPYADEPVQLKLRPASEDAEAKDADASIVLKPDLIAAVTQEPRVRHTVYTARYRLIVKGPERGKWEMDVVDEADAPLLAVETVVRGVQRRAGEDTATVRYDASQLARVLRMPVPE